MLKPKIYLETTLFNYYFLKDTTRQAEIDATKELFEEIKKKRFVSYVSDVTIGEIEDCRNKNLKKQMLNLIEEFNISKISKDNYLGFEKLAQEYIKVGAIPEKKLGDALHIAAATLSDMDILVSWNCAHIVKFKTQQVVHIINISKNLKDISINIPMEVVDDGKNN